MKISKKAILAVALVAVAAFVLAETPAELTKSMQASMDKFCATVKKKDLAGAEKVMRTVFSPTAKITRSNGQKLTFEAWLKNFKAQLGAMKTITSCTMKVSKVKVNGNKATSTETFSLAGTMPNFQDPKKTSTLSVVGTSESVYEKIKGKWLIVSSKDTAEKVLVDGKPAGG